LPREGRIRFLRNVDNNYKVAGYHIHRHENVKYHIHILNFSQSNGSIYIFGHIHGTEYLILNSRQQDRRSKAVKMDPKNIIGRPTMIRAANKAGLEYFIP
jgi:hypothetical protein